MFEVDLGEANEDFSFLEPPPQRTTPYVIQTNNEAGFIFLETTPQPPPSVTLPYVIQTNNGANNGTGVWLTVPKNLVPPDEANNEVYYYCHTILQGVFNKKHDWDNTVRINRKLMQKILGGGTKETRARGWLLDHGVIYTDHAYGQNNFCKSYGLNPLYTKHLTRWEVTCPKLANKIKLSRMQRTDLKREQQEHHSDILNYLTNSAKQITIDLEACRGELNDDNHFNLMPAESIHRKDYHLTRDPYGRVHSPFTQLWRPFRKHLHHNNEPLVETDIRNSQIVFLVKLLKEDLLATGKQPTPDQSRFISFVEEGKIYDHLLARAKVEIADYLLRKKTRQQQVARWHEQFLMHICTSVRPRTAAEWKAARRAFLRRVPVRSIEVVPGEVGRDDFKRMLFADVFFGRTRAITPLTELFRTEFPAVCEFICEQKAHGYEDLARNMQRAEANLMIDTVCLRLMLHHPEVPVVTIHDSILTTAEHLPTVRRIIMEEFSRIDLKPTLK